MYNSRRDKKCLNKTFRICVVSCVCSLAKCSPTPSQSPSIHCSNSCLSISIICIIFGIACEYQKPQCQTHPCQRLKCIGKEGVSNGRCSFAHNTTFLKLLPPVQFLLSISLVWQVVKYQRSREYFLPTSKFPRYKGWVS